ncbi:MAG TPA: cellulose binding domain-containing protein [Trebonia sp.]
MLWSWPLAAAAAAAAVISIVAVSGGGGGPVSVRDAADSATTLTASYTGGTGWGTGYSGQYTITNGGTTAVTGWTLAFRLPSGTSLSSLWNGSFTDRGGQVTVTNDSWDATIAAGGSISVGFVARSSGQAGQPADCTINGVSCSGGSAGTTPASSSATSPAASPSAPAATSPSASPAPSASTPAAAPGTATGFAPYVDTSLYPPFSLVSTAKQTGVKQFNLAFVVSGGGCTPEWGGVTAIGSDPVAAQIGALRAIGGDVRISFGGEAGSELALTCTSVSGLEAAYQQVISAYGIDKIDFDIEGAAVANTAANARRDQAIAALQAQDKGLQVSFTLPVLPSGLTSDGVAVLTGAAQAGVQIAAVNVMAMDYGDGAAPNPVGNMGTFAIDAATAADAQVAGVLGISDTAAWSKIAVTPMIGVNDTSDEIFTIANAQQLASFAASKHLAWLSMWSAGRDTECPGGAQSFAQPTCSSIVQSPDAFAGALGSY